MVARVSAVIRSDQVRLVVNVLEYGKIYDDGNIISNVQSYPRHEMVATLSDCVLDTLKILRECSDSFYCI